jgi:uncharacterized phage protein (TIGR02216 family)
MSFADMALRLSGQAALLLGWKPDDFWNATPAELATILGAFAPPSADVADGQTLNDLMEQFPDAPIGGD